MRHPLRILGTAASALRRLGGPTRGTVACGRCESALLCPRRWAMAGDSRWRVAFGGGECESWTEIVLSNAQAARLDCELDRQLAGIRRAADGLDRERMQAQVEAFVAGLRGGHVLPADFAR